MKTPEGLLEFQEYFVRRGQKDEVLGVELRGIEEVRVPDGVAEVIAAADAIVLCPSNPIVSIGPILAVPGMSEALVSSSAPKVAVSPIIGGRALKGPADEMMRTLGHEVSALGVARIYEELATGFIIDRSDAEEGPEIEALGVRVLTTDAVMHDGEDRARLAREVLGLCSDLGAR